MNRGLLQGFIWILMMLFLWPAGGYGHGLRHKALEGGRGVEVMYDQGKPAVSARVTVFSPGDRENPFQEGFTDRNGRFVFFPDRAGAWLIEVHDGMGHALRHEILVDDAPAPDEAGVPVPRHEEAPIRIQDKAPDRLKDETPPWTRLQAVIVGVSVIFGLFGLLALIKSRARPGA